MSVKRAGTSFLVRTLGKQEKNPVRLDIIKLDLLRSCLRVSMLFPDQKLSSNNEDILGIGEINIPA